MLRIIYTTTVICTCMYWYAYVYIHAHMSMLHMYTFTSHERFCNFTTFYHHFLAQPVSIVCTVLHLCQSVIRINEITTQNDLVRKLSIQLWWDHLSLALNDHPLDSAWFACLCTFNVSEHLCRSPWYVILDSSCWDIVDIKI